ncbi:TcfC E-set like domain-containing protein [Vibrio harveyi]|nr:TcfC E-set like domain-containing protein [Vibrio harveyi]
MQRIYKKTSALFVGMTISSFCLANSIPDGFADFFQPKSAMIKLRLKGDNDFIFVAAKTTYNTVTLDGEFAQKLSQYLNDNNVTPIAGENITRSLLQGVSVRCFEQNTACGIEPNALASYVFDYDKNAFEIVIASSAIVQKQTDSYYDIERQSNALINWSSVYAYHDGLNVNNNTYMGMPIGYLYFDYQLSADSDNNQLFQGIYRNNWDKYQIDVGYNTLGADNFNTSNILNREESYDALGVRFGTSRQLLRGGALAQKTLQFFAPGSSLVEVYKGERLIYSTTVNSGLNHIDYQLLPQGVYTARVVIKSGETVVSEENVKVVNRADFALGVGEFDFFSSIEQVQYEQNTFEPNYLGKLQGSYRLNDTLLLSSGISVSNEDINYSLGARWLLGEESLLEATGKYSPLGEYLLTTRLDLGLFSISAKRKVLRDSVSENHSILQTTYNKEPEKEILFTAPFELWEGMGLFSYSYFGRSQSLNASWSKSITQQDLLSLSTSLSGERFDDYNVSLSWNHSFEPNFSARTYVSSNSNSTNSMNYVNFGVDKDWYSATMTGGIGRSSRDGFQNELSTSFYGKSRYFNSNAYGFYDNQGNSSLSLSLSGTQALTVDGVYFSKQKANSFVALDLSGNLSGKDSVTKVSYNLQKDGSSIEQGIIQTDGGILPIYGYGENEITLDASMYNAEITNHSSRFTSAPGSLFQKKIDIESYSSQLFILENSEGKPLLEATCSGDGCKDVVQISPDGVFKLNFIQGKPFSISSNHRVCSLKTQSEKLRSYVCK